MIYLDFETRSEADIKETGAWMYSLHPSTDIICLAAKKEDAAVALMTSEQLWEAKLMDQIQNSPLYKIIVNTDELFEAHNAFFEKSIWRNVMMKRYGWPDIPDSRWRCSASVAAYHALPRSLFMAGNVLKLNVTKDDEGRRVMLQLAKPNSRTGKFITKEEAPEKFQKLYDYCKTDVDSEKALADRLGCLPEQEAKIWALDQKINMRGVAIDREAVGAALDIIASYTATLEEEARTITEGEIDRVSQRDKTMKWCEAQGEKLPNFTKADVAEAIKKVTNPKVKRVLEIRQELGKTSTAKYTAMKNAIALDDRIRDCLMYHGASTGRWSGKLVQFQNLPRGSIKDIETAVALIKTRNVKAIEMIHGNVMDFLSSAIRGMVVAPKGKQLVVADFAAIEARVLGWLAGSQKMLNQFRNGDDLYKDMASKIYRVPVEEITAEQRQLGKAAILGAGYGMGADKFYNTCLSWGIKIHEGLAKTAINTYRETYSQVRSFWYETEKAAHAAVRNPKAKFPCGKTVWFMQDGFLKCQLPSGRHLHYYNPSFRVKETEFGANHELSYWGEKMGQCIQVGTYGGKLVENVTQAVARDLMAEAMLRVEDAGYEVVLSIHDELIAETKDGSKDSLQKFETLMAQPPIWASDCPIAASGWIGKRYRK